MKSVFKVTASDLPKAVIDTRYDLEVVDINGDNTETVKNVLKELYGKEFEITGDRIYVDGNNSLFKDRYSVGDLMHVMDRLTREDGCPWDRAQTHESIRVNAVEEAYELSEAIDNKDLDNVQEEIGDLLLQAVFHMNIAERTGEFSGLSVINRLVSKLVSRHTHIFGDTKATNPEEALKAWEAAKAVEKSAVSLEEQLERIPESFSALLKSQKILKKLIKNGLNNDIEPMTAEDLLVTIAGCVANGLDTEVDLNSALAELKEKYLKGEINSVSEIADKKH